MWLIPYVQLDVVVVVFCGLSNEISAIHLEKRLVVLLVNLNANLAISIVHASCSNWIFDTDDVYAYVICSFDHPSNTDKNSIETTCHTLTHSNTVSHIHIEYVHENKINILTSNNIA